MPNRNTRWDSNWNTSGNTNGNTAKFRPIKQTTETNNRNKPKRQTVKTWGQQPDSLADSEEQTSHRSYDKDGLGPHKRFD
jgi:hypothetical protein